MARTGTTMTFLSPQKMSPSHARVTRDIFCLAQHLTRDLSLSVSPSERKECFFFSQPTEWPLFLDVSSSTSKMCLYISSLTVYFTSLSICQASFNLGLTYQEIDSNSSLSIQTSLSLPCQYNGVWLYLFKTSNTDFFMSSQPSLVSPCQDSSFWLVLIKPVYNVSSMSRQSYLAPPRSSMSVPDPGHHKDC